MGGLEDKIDDFIICPVRNITDGEKVFLKGYTKGLEFGGRRVHFPVDDTNQNDPIGLNICSENRAAIKKAKTVQIYYNPGSTGTVFDLGMAFMAKKPLFVINPCIEGNREYDMLRFLADYVYKMDFLPIFYKEMLERREEIRKAKLIEYEWHENSRDFLFDFGMVFMAEKPIMLKNREYIETQRTPHKSFQNVLLALDDEWRTMPVGEFEKKYGIKNTRNDLGNYISEN